MRRVVVAAVLILIASSLALPWYLGGQAEAAYRDALTELYAQGLRLVDSRYERGWFRSTALAELEIATAEAQGGEAPRLRIASRLMHGPWHLDAPRPMPAAALVESRVETLIPDVELPPMLMTTQVELDGSGLTSLRVPANERPVGPGRPGLIMPESRGEMRFGPGFQSVTGAYELPSLELVTETGALVSIQGLRSESSGNRGVGGLFVGRGDVKVERVRMQGPDGEIAIANLFAEVESVPRDASVDIRMAFGTDRLMVAGRSYDSARLVLTASGLPAEALAQLRRATATNSAASVPGAQPQLDVGLLLAQFLPLLLAQDPKVALERLEVTTPDGKVAARLSFGTRGMTRDAIERPGVWLSHLVGEGELQIPKSLALELLSQWQSEQVLDERRLPDPERSALSEGPDTAISAAASSQLDALLRDGWAVEQFGLIQTNLRFADAILTINGKTFPLMGLVSP